MYVAWRATGADVLGCSKGLKQQEMLYSLQRQNQRSGKHLERENRI